MRNQVENTFAKKPYEVVSNEARIPVQIRQLTENDYKMCLSD